MTNPDSTPWQWPPRHVLAAVDFGEASARAVTLAGLVASAYDATLRALHAERFEPPPYFTVEQIDRLEAERRGAEQAAARHMREFVARATEYPADALVLDEPPVDAILHAAGGADLVVMGSHRRSRPARWWMGSVAERVVRAATVPVLVVRGSEEPALDVFERVLLLGDQATPDDRARQCAADLAATFGGHLVEGGLAKGCPAEAMSQATLVVMATAHPKPPWGLTDVVAGALGACERPVLFVPSR
jgi:nucleotide-binding universal stress UspA family protein